MMTVQMEAFRPFLEEVKPLFPRHWEELALNKEHVPLDPQYDVYLARDARGEVLAVTVRDNGKLVGYFVGFVAPGLHYRTCLTLTMDIFWVAPEHRGKHAGAMLFTEVERIAKSRGVKRIFVGSKLHKDVSWLFEKLRYEPCEMYFTKWLGG